MIYLKKPNHNPDNYLKVILESFEHYNAIERADIANLLFEGYKSIKNDPKRLANQKALVLEMLSKWIQVFEDLALLCLMFGGKIVGDNREPFEIYSYIHTQKILEFYYKVRKGLPRGTVAKIYAVKTSRELLKEGLINKKEYPFFKQQIDDMVKTAAGNLAKLGSLYSARSRKKKLDYGFLVKVYFQTKHGFKIIHPTETAKKLWQFNDTDIAILKDIVQLRNGRKIMRVGLFEQFDESEVGMLIDRIKGWSEVVNEIVGAQVRYMDNPNFLVPMVRKLKTDEYIKTSGTKPGRNDRCPCESGLKYKKCCG